MRLPRSDSRHNFLCPGTVRHIHTVAPSRLTPQNGNLIVCTPDPNIYTLLPTPVAPSIVCVRAHASQIARLLADLKGDAREVDSHVRLEDDANCLEDEGLKYVYIVRECAMYTRYTHDVYISLRPSPLWALS